MFAAKREEGNCRDCEYELWIQVLFEEDCCGHGRRTGTDVHVAAAVELCLVVYMTSFIAVQHG